MPWVYRLELTEYQPAIDVQDDWEAATPGGVKNHNGGVQVAGERAAIVSTRRNPEYENMADLAYVKSITEHRQIPSDGVYSLLGDEVR